MSYELAIMVLAAAGAVFVIAGLAFFIRPRWFLGWLKGMLMLALLVVGAYAAVIALNLVHYQSLQGMQTVATVETLRTGQQSWRVRLERPDRPPMTVALEGDQWQVDARVIRFGGPMGWLGVAPGYRLERLSGRYTSLEQERSAPRSVVGLSDQQWPDLWALDQAFNLPFIEGIYGNATFMPMKEGAVFEVRLSSSGLVAVPVNDQAREAVRIWTD